jgi:hypothetical protein
MTNEIDFISQVHLKKKYLYQILLLLLSYYKYFSGLSKIIDYYDYNK